MTVPAARKDDLIQQGDSSLLDLVDHLLHKGLLIDGEALISVAGVDLLYLRLSAMLCDAEKLLGEP